MSTNAIKRLARMLLLLLVQLAVLDNVHLLGYASPLVLAYFLLKFRRGSSRIVLLLWGFATGALYDVCSNTVGMGMAASTLLAMLQPLLLAMFAPRDAADDMAPTMRGMGTHRFLPYLFAGLLVFHAAFYALDAFTLADWPLTLASVAAGTAAAFAVCVLLDLAAHPKSSN